MNEENSSRLFWGSLGLLVREVLYRVFRHIFMFKTVSALLKTSGRDSTGYRKGAPPSPVVSLLANFS
jgi:hypothetical protein